MSTVLVDSCPVCGGTVFKDVGLVKDHSISHEDFLLVQCSSCGLRITQEHPDEDSIGPYYASEEYISHSDTRSGLINRLYHEVRTYMLGQKRKLLEQHARSGRLLDIGAGTGYFLAHMRDAGWEVEGLEPDQGAREIAHTRFDLDLAPIETLGDLEESSFDAVSMWHVLEHVHDLNEQLQLIRKVIKPGGTLVIAVPNPDSADAGKYGLDWAAYDVPRHLWHFSAGSMRTLLGKHGFEVSVIKTMPFDAFYVSMLSEKYRKRSFAPVRGGAQGFLTWIASLGNKKRASSLIYVARSDK